MFFAAKTRNLKSEALRDYISQCEEQMSDLEENSTKGRKLRAAELYKKIIENIDAKIGWRPLHIQNILNQLEQVLFEDEDEFYAKWKNFLKQYLALKAKKWKLDTQHHHHNSVHDDTLVCKICEKRFKFDRIVLHSKDCLEREKEKETLATNHKKLLRLSEHVFEKKQELTVRTTIKK